MNCWQRQKHPCELSAALPLHASRMLCRSVPFLIFWVDMAAPCDEKNGFTLDPLHLGFPMSCGRGFLPRLPRKIELNIQNSKDFFFNRFELKIKLFWLLNFWIRFRKKWYCEALIVRLYEKKAPDLWTGASNPRRLQQLYSGCFFACTAKIC